MPIDPIRSAKPFSLRDRLDLTAVIVNDARTEVSRCDPSVTETGNNVKTRILKETALLTGLVFVGLFILPLSIYLVGKAIFGEYGNGGFASFYGQLHDKFRDGEPVVWFLLLTPYLLWQLARLTVWGFRRAKRLDAPESGQN